MTARIVITTFGSYGDINPYVGLALGLRGRGHHPVIATSPFYRQYIEREGIEFHPVRPDVNPDDRDLVARIMDPRSGTDFIIRQLMLPALRETHADLLEAVDGASMLITHPLTYAGPVVAQEKRLPWVSTVLAPMSFFSPHDLPVFSPMPWAKRLESIPGAARLLVRMARSITRSWMEPVRELRLERGLDRGGDPIYEGQHSPELVLALFSRLLGEPQPDWPVHVRITGPVLYNGPDSQQLPSDLEQFLRKGPPPVVFTLGSSAVAAAGTFYDESAAATRRIGMRAILLAGKSAQNVSRIQPGDDLFIAGHAPHAALFPRAAAVVHQCGVGTLHQGLHAGRPMLMVPHAHDQPDNAHRATRLGVGRTLYPRQYRAPAVARELERLTQGSYSTRAEGVAVALRSEDGVARACDAIDARLAG